MKIIPRKFQEGGAMTPEAAPEAAPQGGAPAPTTDGAPEEGAPEGGEADPLMQIAQLAVQALQNQDCQSAMAVCQAFIQLLQSQQGAPEQEAPQGEPVYRKGGKLVSRIRK